MKNTTHPVAAPSSYLSAGKTTFLATRLRAVAGRMARRALLAAAACLLQPALAQAQAFPGGPVTIIVPYAAGGLTDNLGRALALRLSERWGQPVLVDNRAGGGTVIGTTAAARAPGDGRTLLLTSFGFTTNQFMVANLPYKQSALEPLALLAVAPSILFVHPSVPANNVPELVRYLKTAPKPLSIASSGNGSSPHIAAELFASMAGVDIIHVPYRGNGPAINDLIGGQVQALFDSKASLAHVKAGKLKALGVASLQRTSQAPDLTPIAQAGVPALAGFATGSWFGVLVPEATPRDIQNRLYADIRAILETKPMQEAIDRAGVEPVLYTQREFAAYLKAEGDKWGPIIKAKNIQAD
jgi:tripartite-type tricarboxylate transporter receptor subunit TctC